MKHFHVHVAVDDIQESVRFYSCLFGSSPAVMKDDYAKWMLDDPRLNFAISKRAHKTGVNHIGFQVESADELTEMRAQLEAADSSMVEQSGETCCYAKSDKYWITDPAGVAWETFHTLNSVPVYGEDSHLKSEASACCIPSRPNLPSKKASACCVPSSVAESRSSSATCCS